MLLHPAPVDAHSPATTARTRASAAVPAAAAAPPHPAGRFEVDLRQPWRVTAAGDVDHEVALLARSRWSRYAQVREVDLTPVTFIDSAGLGLLMSLARSLRQRGQGRLRVTGAPRQARTMLRLLGADRVLDVTDAADTTDVLGATGAVADGVVQGQQA